MLLLLLLPHSKSSPPKSKTIRVRTIPAAAPAPAAAAASAAVAVPFRSLIRTAATALAVDGPADSAVRWLCGGGGGPDAGKEREDGGTSRRQAHISACFSLWTPPQLLCGCTLSRTKSMYAQQFSSFACQTRWRCVVDRMCSLLLKILFSTPASRSVASRPQLLAFPGFSFALDVFRTSTNSTFSSCSCYCCFSFYHF